MYDFRIKTMKLLLTLKKKNPFRIIIFIVNCFDITYDYTKRSMIICYIAFFKLNQVIYTGLPDKKLFGLLWRVLILSIQF